MNTSSMDSGNGDYFQEDSNHNTSANSELLVLTIDLGETKDNIVVHENDRPCDLAKAFCMKHGLSLNIQENLIDHILANLDKLIHDIATELPTPKKSYRSSSGNTSRILQHVNQSFTFAPVINSNSRRMVRGKYRSPVYERLHKMSMKEPQKIEVKVEKKSSKIEHPGKRLYELAIIKKKEKEIKVKEVLDKKEKEEAESLTFAPEINKRKIKRPSKLEDELIEKGKKLKESLNKMRQESMDKEQSFCTFSPQIDIKSEEIDKKKNCSDRFNYLYKDAKARDEKNKCLAEISLKDQCPFSPKLSNKTETNINSKGVVEKLFNWKKENDTKINKKRDEKQAKETIDPETGAEYFKPNILRGPIRSRNVDVWNELYSKRSSSVESFRGYSPERGYKNPASEKIVDKVIIHRFFDIFQKLKSDNGKITYSDIRLELLDSKIGHIISPLLKEIEESKETLSFEEFCGGMEALTKCLTPEDRNYLLFYDRQKRDKSAETPKMHSRSSSPSSGHEFYNRLMERKQMSEKKIQRMRSEKEISELQECTFQPNSARKKLVLDSN